MDSIKNWKLPPVRKTFSNISKIWPRPQNLPEEPEIVEYVISEAVDGKLGLKPKQEINFANVEDFVNEFVEEIVPDLVDKLYGYCNEIKLLKDIEANDEDIKQKCVEATDVVKIAKEKVLEMNKVRTCIVRQDKDDFDLRIHPAMLKINKTIEYFLEINSRSSLAQICYPVVSAINRSYKAKDLISYLSHNEEQEFSGEADEIHANVKENTASVEGLNEDLLEEILPDESLLDEDPEMKESQLNPLDCLYKHLVDLHTTITHFNAIVQERVDTIETIVDNVTNESIEETKNISKATVLQTAMFPVVGAVVGGVIGGPLGFMAGMKVGSITGGFAMAGVTGTVIGYQGGKILKNRRQKEAKETEE